MTMKNTTPPQKPNEPTPYRKWMMDALGIVIFILNRMAASLAELVRKTAKTRLLYKGSEIIMLEDLSIGLGISGRTVRRYGSDGKFEYYASKDGRRSFLTQEQFDRFIENNFILSTEK